MHINNISNKKIALIGKNGSGKTTLLKCLSGIYFPTSGTIKYDKNNFYLFPMKYRQFLMWRKFIKKNVFYVDHTTLFYNNLSIHDNIKYFVSLGEFNTEKVVDDFDMFCVDESLNKPMKFLSDGTKQKILIALALNSAKKYVFLDEPDRNLDSNTVSIFFNEIKKQTNKTFIISTHIEKKELLTIFDYVCRIDAKEAVL